MNHSTVILDVMYTHTIVIAHKHTSQKVSKSNNNNTEMSPINDHFTSQKRVFFRFNLLLRDSENAKRDPNDMS